MALREWPLGLLGGLVVAVLLLTGGLVLRRRFLARQGAVFELSVNTRRSSPHRGWTLGLGRYEGDRLQWFRVFSLSWRPQLFFSRAGLQVVRRRTAERTESYALYSGHHVILECTTAAGPVQLALSPESTTALLAWLESAPPGADAGVVP